MGAVRDPHPHNPLYLESVYRSNARRTTSLNDSPRAVAFACAAAYSSCGMRNDLSGVFGTLGLNR